MIFRSFRSSFFALCLGLVLVQPLIQPVMAQKRPDLRGTDRLTAAQLKAYLTFIASDELEGRDTPSRGLNVAAKFIAAMLERWGVKPAGEQGTYFQKFDVQTEQLDPARCSVVLNNRSFLYGKEYFAPNALVKCGGVIEPTQLVYAGDGCYVKATGQEPLKGLEVQGKIVVINSLFPPQPAPQDTKSGTDWLDPISYARQNGAVGIISLMPRKTSFSELQSYIGQAQPVVQGIPPEYPIDRDEFPVIVAGETLSRALFAGEKYDLDAVLNAAGASGSMPSFAFAPDKRFSMTLAIDQVRMPTRNVIGVLEGSDPVLKNEYVAISAHYDHVGIGPANATGDTIYNGADDDGSGTVTVLAIAETLASLKIRPKRSILFIWHTGEEQGLWGSIYFTGHPTVPLDRITSLINIDMIGRSRKFDDSNPRNAELSGQNEIYLIGTTLMSTEFEQLFRRVNQQYLNLTYNYKYDDPKDPNKFFFRSDHYSYAKKGIPAAFYFDGEHEDYHRLGDEVDKIDFDKMQKVARTIYRSLWELAELKVRPKVDKQLPEGF
ncbi:MAG TPA: M20/M25/M40 family metallo-hydrolase [Acidobacteriota bacterium]|nr:M20/M25/M40 family metallo-hydrolase [Acidobacteriota bacterium]